MSGGRTSLLQRRSLSLRRKSGSATWPVGNRDLRVLLASASAVAGIVKSILIKCYDFDTDSTLPARDDALAGGRRSSRQSPSRVDVPSHEAMSPPATKPKCRIRRPRQALPIAGGEAMKASSLAGIADLAKKLLHAACKASIAGAGQKCWMSAWHSFCCRGRPGARSGC